VGEGGDEVSVGGFIADQRTCYRAPHTLTCALLGVSLAWFYKWISRTPTATEQRRAELDAAVTEAFGAARGLHGSPRLHADLREAGWTVSEKTVADSMRPRAWHLTRPARLQPSRDPIPGTDLHRPPRRP
jgi:putative transposase